MFPIRSNRTDAVHGWTTVISRAHATTFNNERVWRAVTAELARLANLGTVPRELDVDARAMKVLYRAIVNANFGRGSTRDHHRDGACTHSASTRMVGRVLGTTAKPSETLSPTIAEGERQDGSSRAEPSNVTRQRRVRLATA